MAPIIRTSPDNHLVGTSVATILTRADDTFRLSATDRIEGCLLREALSEPDDPQRPFLVHPRRRGIDDS
jgi:hypothetical protein